MPFPSYEPSTIPAGRYLARFTSEPVEKTSIKRICWIVLKMMKSH